MKKANVLVKHLWILNNIFLSTLFPTSRGGDWDSGGTCNGETAPVLSGAILNNYPVKMKIVEEVIQEMKNPVTLLNVTRLTNFRKDGHPSIFGKNVTAGIKVSTRRQDCSHWCLPGVCPWCVEWAHICKFGSTNSFQELKQQSSLSIFKREDFFFSFTLTRDREFQVVCCARLAMWILDLQVMEKSIFLQPFMGAWYTHAHTHI